ncbi:MAG: SMC family ATPase [Vulcanimicrobiota bacterium]
MKLLRLALQAFGPFQQEQVIDLRALRYSKLFLIHGPVGSGKTFLLDGICFALYGRSSGGERDRSGLRHLGTPAGQETAVTLDFESLGQAYRIDRRFVMEGTRVQPDEVMLYRLPAIGEPTRRDIISSSAGGVEAMISKLFGLNAEQFCQVAILPQGSFRKFLLAEGAERHQILANIFNSSRHQRLEDAVKAAHQQAKRKLEEAWIRREEITARYHSSQGDPREMYQRAQGELEAVASDCRALQERSLEWEQSLEEAVRYEVLDRQRGMSERELTLLREDEDDDEESALVARLQESLPIFEQWRRVQMEAEKIEEELQYQRAEYERLKSDTNFLEEEVEKARLLEEERFNLRRSLERLDTLVEDYQGVQALADELERIEEKLAELGQLRAELALSIKDQKAEIELTEQELEKIKAGEARLAGLKAELDTVERQRGKRRQSEALQEAFEQARAREIRFLDLIDQFEAEKRELRETLARQRELDLEESLRRLKSQLKSGQPCPLCGSETHPDPFQGRRKKKAEVMESEEGLDALERRLEHARAELGQARERVARLGGRLQEREEEEHVLPDLDEQTLSGLRNTIQVVESRVSKKEDLLKELKAMRSELKPARVRLKKMRLLKERLQATVEGVSAQYDSRKEAVQVTMREFFGRLKETGFDELVRSVEEEKQSLEERLEELESHRFSTERAELMAETFALQLAESRASEMRRDELQGRANHLKAELEDSFKLDFAGWDDLSFALGRMAREASVRGDSSVLDRETLIRTVERQLHQSQELLATMPAPEMRSEQIRQVLAREREQLQLKAGRRATLEKSMEQSREDVARYDAVVEEIRHLETRAANLQRLAGLSGEEAGMAFHDWYLQKLFRRVIEAANLRMEVLAPNRFCLGLKAGLEVTVMDFLAGRERSATTLSGGESFLASLALALALGDILQSERDSREKLQTLFIDEGFGYLDKRALEAALDCLESLKQEGRTVGIISHVPALRERIRAQVVLAPNDTPLPYGVERVQVFAE